jgi:hypothetical protein
LPHTFAPGLAQYLVLALALNANGIAQLQGFFSVSSRMNECKSTKIYLQNHVMVYSYFVAAR